MSPFIAEIVGTATLILLGNGVVANVALKDTTGNKEGYLMVTFAWGLAVFCGVVVAGDASGAHLNPAVTIGLAMAGKFSWSLAPSYILAQCIGAAIGTLLIWMTYYDQYKVTDDTDAKLSTFSTSPVIKNYLSNFITEAIGTFVLVFVILHLSGASLLMESAPSAKIGLGSIGALPVALLVVVIGMSLGGPTGYAINPARDFIPRLMHFILPIGKKGSSQWDYAVIPIIGPIFGAIVAAMLHLLL